MTRAGAAAVLVAAIVVGALAVTVAAVVLMVATVARDGAGDEPPAAVTVVAEGSAVGIRAGGCSLVDEVGSGLIVGGVGDMDGVGGVGRGGEGGGQIITSSHVVAGSTEVRVVVGGEEVPAIVDVFDPALDLAVLRAEVEGPDRRAVATAAVAPGAEVHVLAWTPDAGVEIVSTTVSRRLLVTIEDIYRQGEVERRAIELATGVDRGVSGAAVVDTEGRLVGVIYASSRERAASFALDHREVDQVLAAADGRPADPGRCR